MTDNAASLGVVHVIDDDPAMRDSLAFLLESADLTPRVWDSAVAFLDALPDLEPGCILTDVRMPRVSGMELLRRLRELGVRHPVIVMTGHADVPMAIAAMKAGVLDFIEKPFDDEALLATILAALNQDETARRDEREQAEWGARLASLSGREREVLDGLVAGRPNKIIAFDLGISPRTVEIYRANLMTKMQAGSLSDLVRMSLFAQR